MSLAAGDPEVSGKRIPKHLADIYDVDHENPLGSGAFSTVFRCQNCKTGQVLALKQIDTRRGIEMSPRAIAHEIAMMKLAGRHDNVMGCYAVQLEGPYVNIVVDMFSGGDLIDGLNRHAQARGSIPDAQLAHISRQMVAAVLHIHNLRIVHRDVKGENFLSDSADIGDQSCHVALADFGCAARLEPGERLSSKVGTSAFWSPEVFAGDSDHLVDIWALGMTTFILLAGRLPFESEAEICKPGGPKYEMPLRTSSACSHFIQACLAHDPRKRLKADELAQHPWLKTPQPPALSHAEQRVKDSILYGSSVCGCVVRLIVGICSCCVAAAAAGATELMSTPAPQEKDKTSSQMVNTALTEADNVDPQRGTHGAETS